MTEIDDDLTIKLAPAREGYYAAHVELSRRLSREIDSEVGDVLIDSLAEWSVAVGTSPRGWVSVSLSVPAGSVMEATRTACSLVVTAALEAGVVAEVVAAEVMTEREFDIREGWRTERAEEQAAAEVLSAEQAAKVLGVSAVRVRQLAGEGRLQGRKVGKRAWVFERAEVDRVALTRR